METVEPVKKPNAFEKWGDRVALTIICFFGLLMLSVVVMSIYFDGVSWDWLWVPITMGVLYGAYKILQEISKMTLETFVMILLVVALLKYLHG